MSDLIQQNEIVGVDLDLIPEEFQDRNGFKFLLNPITNEVYLCKGTNSNTITFPNIQASKLDSPRQQLSFSQMRDILQNALRIDLKNAKGGFASTVQGGLRYRGEPITGSGAALEDFRNAIEKGWTIRSFRFFQKSDNRFYIDEFIPEG